ncbi:Organic cation transporter protein [Holothuria leucospilota]|uniref:Organic cation transporter protein n=1 Tax=Holothuria leucospilota TaxID=206669 RepID=A0A9Q1BHW5_HOLLE|nr:Organic cation transporter protein [Holothuria leucospilota]
MKFDDIVIDIGEFGPYQIKVFLMVGLIGIPVGFNQMAQVFYASKVDHWCAIEEWTSQLDNCGDPKVDRGTYLDCIHTLRNMSIPQEEDDNGNFMFSKCSKYNMVFSNWTDDNYVYVDQNPDVEPIGCDEGWVYDRSENPRTIISDFNLVCDKRSAPDIAQSIFFAGVLVGSFAYGSLSDIIGRYYAYYIAVAMLFTFSLVTAFSPNFGVYIFFRFFIAAANLGSFLIAFVIGTELVGPSKRVIANCIIQCFFAIGYMLLAVVAFFVRDWRKLQLTIVAPIFLFFLTMPNDSGFPFSLGENGIAFIAPARLAKHPRYIDAFIAPIRLVKDPKYIDFLRIRSWKTSSSSPDQFTGVLEILNSLLNVVRGQVSSFYDKKMFYETLFNVGGHNHNPLRQYAQVASSFVPESARWLISKQKYDRASKIICRAAKVNKKEGKLPENFMEEIKKTEEMHSNEDSATKTVTFIDLFRTPNLRKSTLNFMYNWFINSLVYYGLSLSTSDLGSNVYIAFFISGAVEIPAYFIGVPMMESRLGRRYSTSLCELLGGIACLMTIFLPLGVWKTGIAMIGKFGISASFSLVYIYAAEVIPTPLRSVGVGVCSTAARVGGILSPLILLLDEVWKPLPLIIFGSSAIIGGLLVLLLPESRGKMLPETIEEGEIFSIFFCPEKWQTGEVSRYGDQRRAECLLIVVLTTKFYKHGTYHVFEGSEHRKGVCCKKSEYIVS